LILDKRAVCVTGGLANQFKGANIIGATRGGEMQHVRPGNISLQKIEFVEATLKMIAVDIA
jgi:hypothetical protein